MSVDVPANSTHSDPEALSPIATLRRRTTQQHAQTEAALDLLGRPVTMAYYVDLLTQFHVIFATIENALERHDVVNIQELHWHTRRRTHLLANDLNACGVATNVASAPLAFEIDSSIAAGLGVLYVTEGSTLGGRLIAEHLRGKGLELDCLTFFGGSTQTPVRWKAFRQLVNAHLTDSPSVETAVNNATTTFAFFQQRLSKVGAT